MRTPEEMVVHIDSILVADGKPITVQNRIGVAVGRFAFASGYGTIGELCEWRQVIDNMDVLHIKK